MKIILLLTRIAARNTLRNKRRTLLTMSILALGSSGLIVIGGFFTDLMDGFREVFIHSQTGHLQVNARGYDRLGATDPFQFLIPDLPRVQGEVEKTPHVLFTAPRLSFSGMASSSSVTVGCMALGVDAQREQWMGGFRTNGQNMPSIRIVEGADLDPAEPDGVVLGTGLLASLGLKVGDSVGFVTTRPGGALDGAQFRVRGTFTTFIKDFDDRAMKLNLGKAQAILGTPNQAQSLLVVLDRTAQTDHVKAALLSRIGIEGGHLKDLEIIPWYEMADYYRQSKSLLNKIYETIQLILLIVFVISIGNTVNMAILERTREFGTMLAIGGGRETVFALILMEGFFLGLLGAGLGLLVGTGAAAILSAVGIEMTPPQAAQVYVTRVAVTPPLLLQAFLVAMLSAVIAAVSPAYRICRTRIVESLGYV
ncbi:MAG TPA: FtsX-like permease family protein [bacterium]|nr:FtsX-like permease family protein [bacterium]